MNNNVEFTKTPLLEKYATNITADIAGKIEDFEVYGRDNEIQMATLALNRVTKSSPIFVGEAGVGKTAVVEGIAAKILKGEVDKHLQGNTIWSLEISSLLDDSDGSNTITKMRGIVNELIATRDKNILFIDETHTIMGTGANGSLDIGNSLKTALARGAIRIIGATTQEEFQNIVSKDPAMERRFQDVKVDELTVEQALYVIGKAKGKYERYHHVTISKEIADMAVYYSVDYFPDRRLPDKTLDILDEAGSLVSFEGRNEVTATDIERATRLLRKSQTPMLDKYADNLTQKVSANPNNYRAYGRDEIITKCFVSLKRKSKNSPVLTGDAGVGKTAIIEGITANIQLGSCPPDYKGRTVYSLEMSDLSSINEDGDLIAKFKRIVDELRMTKGKNILFIDEVHTIIGTGSSEGSFLDAGNILKPALSRGEIQIIGATTDEEYNKTILTDKAIERRFQRVDVPEPRRDDAVYIISKVKPKYEKFFNVTYTQEAVEAVVDLAIRYIPERYLPDKAFDLMDEAGARAQVEGRDLVTHEDVARVIQDMKGVSVAAILKANSTRVLELEEKLGRRVKGQDQAIHIVSNAIINAEAGLNDDTRPIASFMFLGTTGTGKTELAKALAEAMFDEESAMIRLDMSEYSSEGDTKKIIGDEQTGRRGTLTDAVAKRPYSVVLFDELEKAHPDCFDLMLQILDDGRLTDGYNRTVDFKNTIVIVTTNMGHEIIKHDTSTNGPISQLSKKSYNQLLAELDTELSTAFRPEFLNRFDDKIVFNMLTEDIIREIVVYQLDKFAKQRLSRQNLSLNYDDDIIDYLVKYGTDVNNGARPLARLLRHEVADPIAKKIIALDRRNNSYTVNLSFIKDQQGHFDKHGKRRKYLDESIGIEIV
ncbi:AAA family ATPase [Streptococcus dentiloxodontae]